MKIVDIREIVVPIKSKISNAYIDFSQMTVSVLALITDVVRDGKPVVGFGFNSNGRYAPSGLLRERFIPRLKAVKPESIVDSTRENLDPFRIWDVLMRNEKPGGHGERSVAVGVLDMAVWDAVAKIAVVPLYRLLADRFHNGHFDRHVFVYAAGGYYYPDKNLTTLQNEMQSCLDLGYSVVKMIWTPLSPTHAPWRPTNCAGMRKPATLSITSCKQKSRRNIPSPWRLEKISSRCRMRET